MEILPLKSLCTYHWFEKISIKSYTLSFTESINGLKFGFRFARSSLILHSNFLFQTIMVPFLPICFSKEFKNGKLGSVFSANKNSVWRGSASKESDTYSE